MSYTAEEIIKKVNKKKSDLGPLIDRWESDFSLFRLEKYKLAGDYSNVTSNDPFTLATKITDNLAYCPMTIRIPTPEDRDERENADNGEKLVYGCINACDSRKMQLPEEPHTQGAVAWYTNNRGWQAIRVLVHKEEDGGDTLVDIDVFDPRNCTWDTAGSKLLWFCHERTISKEEAGEVYGKEIPGVSKLYEFMDDKELYIIIGSEMAEGYPQEHGLDYIPVLITAVGSTPLIYSDKHTDTVKNVGESVYAANRSLYEPVNKLLTLYLTIVSQGAHNPLAIYSSGGKKQFKRSPYYAGNTVQLDIDKGEKVEELYKPNRPADTERLMSHIMQKVNMGGVPPIATGNLDVTLPYSGIYLLTHNATTLMKPRQYAIEKAFEWIAREILSQFAKGGYKAIEVHGRTGTNEYFQCKLKRRDIKGDWWPECKLNPELPQDEMQKANMAQILVANQILSRRTARDKLLNVQDTDAEEDRVLYEMTNSIPELQLLKVQRALREQGEPELAAALPMLLAHTKLGQGQMGQGQMGQGPRSYEGVKNPAFAQGVRPEFVPGQMMGERRPNPQIPPEVKENYRLSQMGLFRGGR